MQFSRAMQCNISVLVVFTRLEVKVCTMQRCSADEDDDMTMKIVVFLDHSEDICLMAS